MLSESVESSQNWCSLSTDRSQADSTSLCVSPGNQTFVHYPEEEKIKLAGILKMAEVKILVKSVFVRHSHRQQAGACWNGRLVLRNHNYVISEELI